MTTTTTDLRRVPPVVAVVVASQVAVLSLDFSKIGFTSSGGVDLGRWLVIMPGQVLLGVLLLVTSHQLFEVLRRPPAVALLLWLMWNWTTVAWSVDPRQTIIMSFGAINLLFLGAWFARVYGQRAFAATAAGAIACIAGAGVVYQWVGPGAGVGTRLEGLAEGYNLLATQCSFGIILALAARGNPRTTRLWTVVAVALTFALVATGGRIALAATLCGVAFLMRRWLFAPRRVVPVVLGAVVALGVVFAAMSSLQVYARSDSGALNGRDLVWSHAADLIDEAPVAGHGMMTGERIWTAALVQGAVNFSAGGAHNMFLEILVGGGIVGGVLFLAAMGTVLRAAIRTHNDTAITLILLAGVMGATESLIHRPSLTYFIFGGVVASTATDRGRRCAASEPVREPVRRVPAEIGR